MPELSNLDLLRSVAVCLVMFSHGMLYLGYVQHAGFAGVTGVCMFFVHTCCVLMGSLERDPHPGRFYLRRIFRIYPLWLVILTLTLLLRLPMSPSVVPVFEFIRPTARDVAGNALLCMNVYGYPDIVGASWTLPLEVQMYLFLPLLFAFVRNFRVLWPLLILQGYVMAYAWLTVPKGQAPLILCVPYFLPGVMAYVLYQRKRLQRLPGWMFVLYLAVITTLMTRYGTFTRGWWFCLSLGVGLPLFRQVSLAPMNRMTAIVARYSYGLYLVHIPALCVGVWWTRSQPMVFRVGAFLAVLLILPAILYHAIERPLIRLGSRLAGKIERGPEPRPDERMMRMEPAP